MECHARENRPPRISIAMAIFNCCETLSEAVESILAQTCSDWELILCDDGSTDRTMAIARDYALRDSRIRVIRNLRNLGLNHALNHCLREARGEFYARMDGDDTCEPDRIAKLAQALDAHPEISVVSSWMTCFDADGTWGVIRTLPAPDRFTFLRGTPFIHAACMMRTRALRDLGGYNTEPWLRRAEDLELWFRFFAKGYRGLNLQESLYHMRDDRQARARRTFQSRLVEARVLWRGYQMLGMPWHLRLWALKPIAIGLMPAPLYNFVRRRLHRADGHSSAKATR